MTRFMHPVPATRLLILGAVLAAVAAACTAGSGSGDTSAARAADPGAASGVASPAPAASPGGLDVGGIANDLRAATARHDVRAADADRELLANRLGRAQLDSIESTYRLLLADLDVAMASHDAQGIARHRAEFETLCAPGTLTGLLQDCDADLAAVMR
jgi:hypothetical protein